MSKKYIYPNLEKGQSKEFLSHEAIAVTSYSSADFFSSGSRREKYDLENENQKVSCWIRFQQEVCKKKCRALLVPGHSQNVKTDLRLTSVSKQRLNLAVKSLISDKEAFVLLSGGNVKPVGTPYNEAYEMKQYLMSVHRVPGHLIALEPFARNSVENLVNSARFLKSHNLREALVITTPVHNLYYGFPLLSSFYIRSLFQFHKKVGKLSYQNLCQTRFRIEA